MRYYVGDFNGILHEFKQKMANHLATPRDADVWLVFQDCQGSYKDLIKTAKDLGISKPVYTVQHGRHATYDYGAPNSFPLLSDKYLCWGKNDYDNMVKLGYGDKTHIVGCPLNSLIKPKVNHNEKTILFVPVNTGKEEPENIAAYYELTKIRYGKAQNLLMKNRVELKDKWGMNDKLNVSFNGLTNDFNIVAKLLPWHDRSLYHGSVLTGFQDQRKNNELVFSLLQNVDLVVGIDEGCTETFAYAHDVPVIIVDGFKYRQHREKGFVEDDIYRTKAATHVKLDDLERAIDFALAHPEHLRKERAEVAEAEMGLSYGNATDNIIKLIRSDIKNYVKA